MRARAASITARAKCAHQKLTACVSADKTDDVTLLKQEIERLKAEKVAAAHKIEELENVIKQLRAGAAPAHPQHAPAPHHR